MSSNAGPANCDLSALQAAASGSRDRPAGRSRSAGRSVLNGAPSPVGPRVPPTTQDVDAELGQVLGEPSTVGDTADWTNLSSFSGHGGKLLFYHGVSDPWFPSRIRSARTTGARATPRTPRASSVVEGRAAEARRAATGGSVRKCC